MKSAILQAIHYVNQSAKGWAVLNLMLTVLQGILPLGFLWMMKLVIDAIQQGQNVVLITILTGLVFLINMVAGIVLVLVREYQTQQLSAHMHDVIHEKANELELAYFDDPHYFDLFHRAAGEAAYRPGRIVNGLFLLLQSTVSLLALGAILITLHWSIALILLVAAIPALLGRVNQAKSFHAWNREKTPSERRLQYYHHILTGQAFAKEIRLFGLAPYFIGLFKDLNHELKSQKLRFFAKRAVMDIMAQIFAVLIIFGTLIYISSLAVSGIITMGAVVMYFLAFQRGAGFVRDATQSIASLYDDQLYMQHLDEFLSLKKLAEPVVSGVPFPVPLSNGIQFHQVSFQYPGSQNVALENMSFILPSGKTTALVGANGAGKSTLVKLICGLYPPSNGDILADGINYKNIQTLSLRQNISALFQDFILYYLTVNDNIRFGRVEVDVTESKIRTAAKDAGAEEMINNLPDSYHTLLGRTFANSAQLSIGEWQKLALARAFYRDAPVIILDEPSSAMDARAEANLFSRFKELSRGKTALVISHRFSTVKDADHILVLDKGRLVEEGTHDELMKLGGVYAGFYNIQADRYN